MRVGQKNKLTYRWARTGSRPRAIHDQRTQSTYLFGAVCPNAEPARPSFCLSATPKPCSFISTRSPQGSPLALTQSSSSIRLAGTAPKISNFPPTYRSCRCRRVRRSSTPRKHLAVHATELAVQSHLQILRRYRRSLLLRLEHADRSALENHVHRTPRLGNRRSANLRVGMRCHLLPCRHPTRRQGTAPLSEAAAPQRSVVRRL